MTNKGNRIRQYFKESISNKKRLISLCLIALLTVVKFAFDPADHEEYHELITLTNFVLYFSILVIITGFLIKKKKILLVNFTVLMMLLVLAELISYFYLGMPIKGKKDYGAQDYPPDHVQSQLGFAPLADSVWRHHKIKGNDTIFDTYYSADKHSRRITPGYDNAKDKHAIFFGCSICFGFGLKDDQTIPYYLQEKTKSYNSYNYAFNGWGTHHMLARLEYSDLSKEVKEKEGIGIYIFIWPHIRRAICDMRLYTSWGHGTPYYFLEDGELVRDGNFVNGRWFTSKLYEFLDASYLWGSFEVNLPIEIEEKHMILTAEMIKKSKEKYIEQFGNNKFYVIIYPLDWAEFTLEKNKQFKKILTERGIDYLDYSDKLSLYKDHNIVGDGHPNEKSNQEYAKLLVQDLNLK